MPRSVATRMALGYGLLIAGAITLLALVFYFGTLGAFDRAIDHKIVDLSDRLADGYGARPLEDLAGEIRHLLADGIDSDTEIYLLKTAHGENAAGNLDALPDGLPQQQLVDARVLREGRKVPARLMLRRFGDGSCLVVGRSLEDREAIRDMVWRALAFGALLSLLLAGAGAAVFRRQIEARVAGIRQTAREIEAGDLTRRIPIPSGVEGADEFGRLKGDINRMLDRIQHLVDGVRHVSNAIAHDLRTPLGRVRNRLESALTHAQEPEQLAAAAGAAIADIDELIRLFERLLQIAQAESGVRTESFERIDLVRIAADMVELYREEHEDSAIALSAGAEPVHVRGDRNLIAAATSGLIDNAIKYAGATAQITVGVALESDSATLFVRDDGPGIPPQELSNVVGRFYRLDRSRHLPGNGLGLTIAAAIAKSHGGALVLAPATPGLLARLVLPRAD